ncbi:MAG TPA: hypothetical protein VK783_13635 [Bacteroidia bacterium]|jgi:hypothetical protein|nr:hypothetical protein [Bacteroidia bacterium]
MCIIAFTLGLLVIVAGMKLLAQTQKDNLSNLFKYVSWFVIVMGFLSLIGTGLHCAMNCCHRHEHRMMMRECRMMDNDCDEMQGCGNMMHCQHGMGMMRGDGGCMMHSGNCGMGGSCNMGNDNCNMGGGCCKEGMGSECHEGMSSSCPMMGGGHCDMKDSVVVKKETKK